MLPSNLSATSQGSREHDRNDLHDSGIDSSSFSLEDPLSRYRHESLVASHKPQESASYRTSESSLYRPPPIKSAPTPWPNPTVSSYRGEQNSQTLGSPSFSPYASTSTLPANSALFGNASRDSAGYPDYMRPYGMSAGSSSSRLSDNHELPPATYSSYDRPHEQRAESSKASPSPKSARVNRDLSPGDSHTRGNERSDVHGSAYEDSSRAPPPAPDAITQHYRGASSGIPSLHARRTEPDDRRAPYLSDPKRYRANSGTPDIWPFARSPLSSNPPSRSSKPEMDVMMPYGSARGKRIALIGYVQVI